MNELNLLCPKCKKEFSNSIVLMCSCCNSIVDITTTLETKIDKSKSNIIYVDFCDKCYNVYITRIDAINISSKGL